MIKIEYRTEKLSFRVTEDELKKIEEKAAKANMNISEYLRRASLGRNVVVIKELKDFTKDLRGISRNLNQLTILAHQGKIKFLNLSTTKERVDQIWQLLNSLTEKMRK